MNFPTIQTGDKQDHWKTQTASFGNQVPFYFGGSAVPFVIGTPKFKPIKTANITVPEIKINQQILRFQN